MLQVLRTQLSLAAAGCLCAATPATADELLSPAPKFDLSLMVATVSDYRDRGVSLSGGAPAIQGQVGVAHASGAYAFGWISTIDSGGADIETQAGLGYAFTRGQTSLDAWVAYNAYPGAKDYDFAEVYLKAQRQISSGSIAVTAAYAPSQPNIGGTDNLHLSVEGRLPLPGSSVSLVAAAGWENGAFADDKIDWRIGLRRRLGRFDCAIELVDAATRRAERPIRPVLVLSINRSL